MKQRMIARKIKDLRVQLGITGPQLARKIGITQAQISRLENGLQGFRAETLLSFCKAFGVPPVYFFLDDSEAQTAETIAELQGQGLKPGRRFQEALASPAYLKFIEECARVFNADESKLKAMDAAARGSAWFPPKW